MTIHQVKLVYGVRISWEKMIELGYIVISEDLKEEETEIQMQVMIDYGRGTFFPSLNNKSIQVFRIPSCLSQCEEVCVGVEVMSYDTYKGEGKDPTFKQIVEASKLMDNFVPKELIKNSNSIECDLIVIPDDCACCH
jgi:hypothetical protein